MSDVAIRNAVLTERWELIEWVIINSIDAVDDDDDIPDDAVDRVETATATVEKDYEGFIDDLEMVEMAVLLSKQM